MRRAAAIVVAVLLVALGGIIMLAFREGETEVAADGRTVVVTETASETVTVVVTEPSADDGILPAPVAETRAALLAAADARDHDALAALAPDDFSYTFGGPVDGGPAEYWRQLEETTGENPLATLAALLRLPYTLHGGIYTWPFAFDRPPDELSEYERGLLEDAIGDVDAAYAGGVGYAGWRTGIEPDGTWRFFIAGD